MVWFSWFILSFRLTCHQLLRRCRRKGAGISSEQIFNSSSKALHFRGSLRDLLGWFAKISMSAASCFLSRERSWHVCSHLVAEQHLFTARPNRQQFFCFPALNCRLQRPDFALLYIMIPLVANPWLLRDEHRRTNLFLRVELVAQVRVERGITNRPVGIYLLVAYVPRTPAPLWSWSACRSLSGRIPAHPAEKNARCAAIWI